jgi:hypothetical protein
MLSELNLERAGLGRDIEACTKISERYRMTPVYKRVGTELGTLILRLCSMVI